MNKIQKVALVVGVIFVVIAQVQALVLLWWNAIDPFENVSDIQAAGIFTWMMLSLIGMGMILGSADV